MDQATIIDKLQSLLKLDSDAVQAYTAAIDRIPEADIKRQFELFREDHARHVRDLTKKIRDLGSEPTSPSPDVKGFLLKGFTAITSMMGTKAALKAMQTNEQLTNKSYADAAALAMPLDAKALIDKNFADEKKHLAYVNAALEEKSREKVQV
jgi:rubrerythrin